jgi:putative hydrolase of the HAD superfamily
MSLELPEAVLLDLDDTILVFDALAEEAWRTVSYRFEDRLGGATPAGLLKAIEDERLRYWGDPARHRRGRLDLDRAWEEVARGGLSRVGIDDSDLAQAIGSAYSAEREAAVHPVPGALETLRRLRDADVSTALVTNGSATRQRGKLERFGLEAFFDYILIEGEFGAGKPDESVFLHALEQLDAAPGDAWMVGDRLDFDIETPKRLGMRAVWIDVKGSGVPKETPVRPDRVIGSLPELLRA